MRERKTLTQAIARAIDGYADDHPNVTIAEIVISMLVIWRTLWRKSPRAPANVAKGHVIVSRPPALREAIGRT